MNHLYQKLKSKELKNFWQVIHTRIASSELTSSSIVVAYYLLMSLFPLFIVIGNLLPLLQINPNSILPYLQEVIPEAVYDFLEPAIRNLLTQGSGSLLSISAIATLWPASQSINALQKAMNKAYGVERRGNFLIVRFFSLLAVILLLITIVGVTFVVGFGRQTLEYLQPIFHYPTEIIQIFSNVRWPLTIITTFSLMTMIFWVVPNVQPRLRTVIPGAIFSTIGWFMLAQVFGIYAKYFMGRVGGYQIIGSFVVMMLWLNFAAMLIILGSILNAVIEELTRGKIEERTKISEKIAHMYRRIRQKNEEES